MPKAFSGLKIELSISQICNECGQPIVNTGCLAVCKYRGTAAQQATLYYHKLCLFKSTMQLMPATSRGYCQLCSVSGNMNFAFIQKHGIGRQHSGKYHKNCVEEFLKRRESEFYIQDDDFARVLSNFDKTQDFSKVKKLQQLDYLFTRVTDYDLLQKNLKVNSTALLRFMSSLGPVGKLCSRVNEELRERYIKENFKEILANGVLEAKKKGFPECFEARKLLLSQVVANWNDLHISLKERAVNLYIDVIPIECVKQMWNRLSMETRAHFCKNGHVSFDFYEEFLKAEQESEMNHFLKENCNLDDRVKLIVNEEENVLAKTW